jgi:hypothetical protein
MIDNPVPDAGGGCRIPVTIRLKVRLSERLATYQIIMGDVRPKFTVKLNYSILKEHIYCLTG